MKTEIPVPGLTRDLLAKFAEAPDQVRGARDIRPSTGGQA